MGKSDFFSILEYVYWLSLPLQRAFYVLLCVKQKRFELKGDKTIKSNG